MSLINKMLQDLDARGGARARDATGDVRPVAAESSSARAVVIGAGVGALIVAAGIAGWYYANRQPAVTAAPVVAPAPAPATPARPPAPPAVTATAAEPVATDPTTADPTAGAPSAAVPAAAAGTQPAPEVGPQASPTAGPKSGQESRREAAREAAAVPVAAGPAPAREEDAPTVRPEPKARAAAPRAPRAERPAAAPAAADRTVAPAAQGAGLTARQQGENAYRRALGALQEGRVTEGIATLEQAVELYPRHEAARQTLVGLLLENGRPGDAMRHAQLGLELDANQPQLAMVLARLQLERGGAADETLLRSLPHAAGNADYIAFLAGVLQKQGRHREAAQQYEAALRLRPANGVWWMGLGISYQAENLRTNAHDAYVKAKEAGLSPELQAFVERRLAQLR